MSQMLDPVTQNHVRQAAEALTDEFAGVFSQETSSATSRSRSTSSATARSTSSSRFSRTASHENG